MSTTVAAMKARLGNTDYYILSMKAQELVNKVKIPKEIEGWGELSIDARYQRDINYNRVKTQIAPYLVQDKSRFFGAIIVAAFHFDDNIDFEPLNLVVPRGIPRRYGADAESMGFLNFRGGEMLVPLDGQHRLKAIEFALTGRDEKSKDIPNMNTCADLAQEDVTVILIPYTPTKARKIFTRVNRYAKPTTTGQNIIVDDDDIVAVLAREITNELIGGHLVKYDSNTLRNSDPEFTTLSIIYNCNEAIITATFPGKKIDKTQRPSIDKERLYRDKVKEIWETILEDIEVYADMLHDKKESGDDKRREIRRTNLLGRPVTQECLVRAFVRLRGAPSNIKPQIICRRLNKLPWEINENNVKIWQRILWNGGTDGKIITKSRNRNLTTDIISYMAGEKLSEEQRQILRKECQEEFLEEERKDWELPEQYV